MGKIDYVPYFEVKRDLLWWYINLENLVSSLHGLCKQTRALENEWISVDSKIKMVITLKLQVNVYKVVVDVGKKVIIGPMQC